MVNKKVQKKGYLRTVEAVIAFLLTFALMLIVQTQNSAEVRFDKIAVLSALEQKDSFRACVMNDNATCAYDEIRFVLPREYSFNVTISIDPYMAPNLPIKNIYSDHIWIAGNSTKYSPRIVRLYYWK